jgi:Flp pilus assembly protein TadG
MRAGERTLRSEQGAVFVQVGISIFVLMAFNVFVLDYGVMWVSRRQAQNAADAGALAGAVARGYDNFDAPDAVAEQSATQVAAANLIWNEAGVPVVSHSCPPGVTGSCTRVDVHRDAAHGNPIDTLFGQILGISSQGVRATATAIVGSGNATDCLRPIAFADDWQDNRDDPPLGVEFSRYAEPGPGTPVADADIYTAPSATQTGRTISLPPPGGDLGERIIWALDLPTTSTATPITRDMVVGLTLAGPGAFWEKVRNCGGTVVQLGQTLPVEIPPAGDVDRAFDELILADPSPPLVWHAGAMRIDNSCAPQCASISPRLIPVALYDPDKFQLGRATNNWTQAGVGCPSNSPCITVTNIVGFFVHGPSGIYGPHGHFLKYPGIKSTTAPTPVLVDNASWLVTTHLIR